jgi:hypothetical protein
MTVMMRRRPSTARGHWVWPCGVPESFYAVLWATLPAVETAAAAARTRCASQECLHARMHTSTHPFPAMPSLATGLPVKGYLVEQR